MPIASSSSDAHDVSQHAGLNNLGNTCFLNSVLQPLSATRLLHHLYFPLGDLALAERSYRGAGWVLTDHGPAKLDRRKVPALLLADEENHTPIDPPLTDQQADDLLRLLPLSNVFRQLLQKTWRPMPSASTSSSASSSKRVPPISPSELLRLLAEKFDQYSYKEQQDAHELLRLLLDAMRMEEVDFIKRVQPPRIAPSSAASSSAESLTEGSLTASIDSEQQLSDTTPSMDSTTASANPPSADSNRTVIPGGGDDSTTQTPTMSNLPTPSLNAGPSSANDPQGILPPPAAAEEGARWTNMNTLIDVVWGGRLASMVICEGCRHISHNYEDFLDISLPLRPEDALTGPAHRRHRMRLVPERWKRSSAAGTAGGLPNRPATARQDILKGTLDVGGGSTDCPSTSDTSLGTLASPTSSLDKKSKRLSRIINTDDDDEVVTSGTIPTPTTDNPSTSSSWTAWAASLGRSKSARPSSAKGHRSNMNPAKAAVAEEDSIDMPDMASLAVSPRPATTQPLPGAATEYASANGLNATLEAKTRGSRDLLTALSNASRANSRAGSRNRDGDSRSTSPGVERTASPLHSASAKDSERPSAPRHENLLSPALPNGHLPHLQSFMPGPASSKQTAAPVKEPSKQAQYIVRVFSEPSDACTVAANPFPADTFRARVREAQAKTGLVTAIRSFTSSEVLADDNAFHCRRCWRRLNPPQGDERERLRRHRVRKGKDASGSEDSEDDVDDEETRPPPPARTNLVAPQPKRAVDKVLKGSSDGGDTDDADESSDEEAERLAAKTEIVVDPPHENGPPSAMVELLEAGARTPVSRSASAQDNKGQETESNGSPVAGTAPADSAQGANHLGGASDPALVPAKPNEVVEKNGPRTRAFSTGVVPDAELQIPSITGSQTARRALPGVLKESLSVDGAAGTPKPSTKPATQPSPRQPPSAKSDKLKRSTQSIARRALKRYLIAEFPAVIPFHLKRFHAEGNGGKSSSLFSSAFSSSLKKIDDLVTYPLYLDMAEWMAPPREEYDRYGRLKPSSHPDAWEAHRSEAEGETTAASATSTDYLPADLSAAEGVDLKRKSSRWHRPFSRPQSAAGRRSKKEPKTFAHHLRGCVPPPVSGPAPLYRLYAVTNHQGGSTTSGHYTTYILSDRVTGGRRKKSSAAERNGHSHGRDVSSASTAKPSSSQDTLPQTSSDERLSSSPSSSGSGNSSAGNGTSEEAARASTASIFDPGADTRSWVWCSDSDVRPVSEETVLKNKDAYILFYERVE